MEISRPLSDAEEALVADLEEKLHVRFNLAFEPLDDPLMQLGKVSSSQLVKLERGDVTVVPLFVAKILEDEGIASTVLPEWLTEDALDLRLREISQSKTVDPPPSKWFEFVASYFFNLQQDPWFNVEENRSSRPKSLVKFRDYVAKRQQIISEHLIDRFAKRLFLGHTNLSQRELRRLGLPAFSLVTKLKAVNDRTMKNCAFLAGFKAVFQRE
ncbi:MAG: uncharacterized protein KVP18_003123 [Porospora cf. gigantea A]|uniref:uncharacterized protein n=1 Tax=Porospora cf. gigantea A TaxID=2853593 RepID=UPI00355AB47F|nr:MAG: hypothetical protein KVP18_003123 [Porospora cf. gigantea A]